MRAKCLYRSSTAPPVAANDRVSNRFIHQLLGPQNQAQLLRRLELAREDGSSRVSQPNLGPTPDCERQLLGEVPPDQ
jgi:hypothetical protein